jgi:flavin reductase (DIM6/NTAB) family NADH-FMN oxidoreductase RutF
MAGIPFDNLEFRRTLGAFTTGVTVVTSIADDGGFHGITVNSFSSVSLNPPLILWSLALDTPDFMAFKEAKAFAVHILAEHQAAVSARFASLDIQNKFKDIDVEFGLGGVPLLKECTAILECLSETCYPGGDHVILLGRVQRIQRFLHPPLIFWNGQYRALTECKPLLA